MIKKFIVPLFLISSIVVGGNIVLFAVFQNLKVELPTPN
jgi:hypothetical protein